MSSDHTTAHESAIPMLAERSGPLTDVRVIDLTRAISGPYCTMILADMGADVIKVETPPLGDSVRVIGPHTEADSEHLFGGYFATNNRNKRSVLLDLRDPDDLQRLRRLIDTADLLVENFRPGVMESMGLAYESLSGSATHASCTAPSGGSEILAQARVPSLIGPPLTSLPRLWVGL